MMRAVLSHKLDYFPPEGSKMPSKKDDLRALLSSQLGKDAVVAPHRAAVAVRAAIPAQ